MTTTATTSSKTPSYYVWEHIAKKKLPVASETTTMLLQHHTTASTKQYMKSFLWMLRSYFTYRKVPSSSLSCLVAQFQVFRRLMKGKFDAYVLWPLGKKFQNWKVDRSTAPDFTVGVSLKQFWFHASLSCRITWFMTLHQWWNVNITWGWSWSSLRNLSW